MAGERPTGVGYELKLEGSEAALRKLGAAAERLEYATPLFDLVGAMLVTSTRDRFERETDPEGTPWPSSIRVQLEGGKTLFDSGHLANSFSHEPSNSGVEVGTNVLYAAIQQFGGVIRPVSADALHFSIGGRDVFVKEVTIPRRAFLGLEAADEEAIEEIAGDYVLAPFVGSGADAG